MNPAPSSSWCLTCKYQLARHPSTISPSPFLLCRWPPANTRPTFLWPKQGKAGGQPALAQGRNEPRLLQASSLQPCCRQCFPSVSGSALLRFPRNLWWELSCIPAGYLYAQRDQGARDAVTPDAGAAQWTSAEGDGTERAPSLSHPKPALSGDSLS